MNTGADSERREPSQRWYLLRIVGVLCLAQTGTYLILDRILHFPAGWLRFLLDVVLGTACASPYLCYLSRGELRRRMAAEEEVRRHAESQAALYQIARLSFLDLPLQDVLGGVLDCLISVSWLGLDQHGAVFLSEDGAPTFTCALTAAMTRTRTCARAWPSGGASAAGPPRSGPWNSARRRTRSTGRGSPA